MNKSVVAPVILALASLGSAHAAQPTEAPASQNMPKRVPPKMAVPGTLNGLAAAPAMADVGKALKFKLAGSGFAQ